LDTTDIGTIRVLGLTAAMFSLLDLLIIGGAAIAARPAIISMQRSLVIYSQGGGVSIDHLGDPLFSLFLLTYGSALICLLITLGFCWYAGRIAGVSSGGRPGHAGTTVALMSGLVWFIIGIPVILLTHADGTVSWLVATAGVILLSPTSPPLSAVYLTSPGGLYILIQLGVLLLQLIVFFFFALSCGALAARIGASKTNPAP
jgi:hypothetical protein